MTTAVDTSVLLAIAKAEPSARAWVSRLAEARHAGALLACEIVWAETRVFYRTAEVHASAMAALGVQFNPIEEAGAALAGELHGAYRKAGGKRDRLIPDFLIGTHALTQAGQLATADAGFFRNYFNGLKIVSL